MANTAMSAAQTKHRLTASVSNVRSSRTPRPAPRRTVGTSADASGEQRRQGNGQEQWPEGSALGGPRPLSLLHEQEIGRRRRRPDRTPARHR
jgi:hypothetical protein